MSSNFHKTAIATFLLVLVLFWIPCHIQAQSPVDNGEFDNQFATSPDWWWGHGGCTIVQTTEQANNGSHAALVSNRTEYWQGAAQELDGDLTIGKDYHFQCWVRTKDVPSGVLRIEVAQTDDRDGIQYTPIAKVLANDSQWTLLEGGFRLLSNGNLDDLRFFVSGDYTDDRLFDYYVDSVTITENDWRAAADQRIEQFRKRDVVLNFEDADGNLISDIEVDIQQIGHRFAFGSTLNDGFIDYQVYADFFRQNFDWATIEWYSQWKSVEEIRGVENYTRADATVEFAKANGIQLRGHALAWPDTRFMPAWLEGLSPEEHRDEINERIDSVVSRYAGRLVHWDVNNEMLNFTYFQDVVGPGIRADMFIRAKANDSNVKLFTNEFGLTESGYKTDRYRQLIQGLQNAGADVGGIGLQSHYDGNVSPKAMELTLAKLTDLGPEIWFTEFDVSNPDPVERAKLLETFYRYAFSVPEADGIIMWGFWAGNHWRGEDAAIVDIDWTINDAGQKYFELMNEWTTQVSTSVSGGINTVGFRGFYGTYHVTTTDSSGIVNHHLVTLQPGEVGAQEIVLRLSSKASNVLNIYGTEEDDLFEFDFGQPDLITINGSIAALPVTTTSQNLQLSGLSGDDAIEVNGTGYRQNYLISDAGIINSSSGQAIFYDAVESIDFYAGYPTDRIVVVGTPEQELYFSSQESTVCQYADKTISVINFENVLCRSNGGNDIGVISDSEEFDYLNCNFRDFLSIRSETNLRRFYDFGETIFSSSGGNDFLVGELTSTATSAIATLENLTFTSAVSYFEFSNLQQTSISSNPLHGHTLTADLSANASSDRIYKWSDLITLNQSRLLRHKFKGFTDVDLLGDRQDRLFMADSALDDNLVAESDQVILSGGGQTVTANNFRVVAVNGINGGVNTADVSDTSYSLYLPGDWIDVE